MNQSILAVIVVAALISIVSSLYILSEHHKNKTKVDSTLSNTISLDLGSCTTHSRQENNVIITELRCPVNPMTTQP